MLSLEPHLRVRTFAVISHSQTMDSAYTIWTEWMIRYYGAYCLSATCSTQTTCAGDWAATTCALPTSMFPLITSQHGQLTPYQRTVNILHLRAGSPYTSIGAFSIRRPLPAYHNASDPSPLAWAVLRARRTSKAYNVSQEPGSDRPLH